MGFPSSLASTARRVCWARVPRRWPTFWRSSVERSHWLRASGEPTEVVGDHARVEGGVPGARVVGCEVAKSIDALRQSLGWFAVAGDEGDAVVLAEVEEVGIPGSNRISCFRKSISQYREGVVGPVVSTRIVVGYGFVGTYGSIGKVDEASY